MASIGGVSVSESVKLSVEISTKLSLKEQDIIVWLSLTRGEYPFNFKLWFLTIESAQIFNERAARRSRSTSRFGCSFVCRFVCPLPHEQLRNNFKVELRWLPLTESTQKFLCDSVCVSSNRKSKIEKKNRKSKIVKKKKIEKKNEKVDSSFS